MLVRFNMVFLFGVLIRFQDISLKNIQIRDLKLFLHSIYEYFIIRYLSERFCFHNIVLVWLSDCVFLS